MSLRHSALDAACGRAARRDGGPGKQSACAGARPVAVAQPTQGVKEADAVGAEHSRVSYVPGRDRSELLRVRLSNH